ncbi:hypothetical protein [Pedobacter hiemivivus]|uniref:Uncharacterized protein n=1 Tax=Pedobacter hiemivivus TaxID=2530454 RepID=A0A4R0N4X0_9SPHI|nr:hypothetical protein [Pedobacter hiemivivus]TCC94978.1 hypothetical protein EZ444_15825 [Pedobacter hiemivivus]
MKDKEKSPQIKEVEKIIFIEHPECNRTIQGNKAILSKKSAKRYKVTVRYITVTSEEAKIKRAIIESIMKKGLK